MTFERGRQMDFLGVSLRGVPLLDKGGPSDGIVGSAGLRRDADAGISVSVGYLTEAFPVRREANHDAFELADSGKECHKSAFIRFPLVKDEWTRDG